MRSLCSFVGSILCAFKGSVWEARNYLEWLSNTKKSQLGLLEEKKTKSEREKKVDALCAIPGVSQKNAESLIESYGVCCWGHNQNRA